MGWKIKILKVLDSSSTLVVNYTLLGTTRSRIGSEPARIAVFRVLLLFFDNGVKLDVACIFQNPNFLSEVAV